MCPDWGGTGNPGVCPDQESNWRPFGLQDNTGPTEPHWPGQCYSFDVGKSICSVSSGSGECVAEVLKFSVVPLRACKRWLFLGASVPSFPACWPLPVCRGPRGPPNTVPLSPLCFFFHVWGLLCWVGMPPPQKLFPRAGVCTVSALDVTGKGC